ncbi:MAG: zinc-dependent peptidase [Burkholderiales bacterium]|nr:zinc-dependent peptidase [Burkholderiales bacterium]
MFGRWRRHWLLRQEAAALRRRAIADDLWKRTRVRYPFLQRRDPATDAELRRLTSLFLDRKEFSAVGGLALTDAMAVAIAAQAVLPVLRLGLAAYDGFVGIVIHPDQVVARREVADEDGIVHEYDEVLAGEAMEGGPVMLSWHDVRAAGRTEGTAYNVVIHEFAHVLDLTNGEADGMPLLPPGLAAVDWRATLGEALARLRQAVAADAATVIDPYGAEGEEEFFAVASEAFFVSPAALRQDSPALYALLVRYYRQDPAEEMAQPPSRPVRHRRGT